MILGFVQLTRMRRGTRPYKEAVERTRALVTERTEYYAQRYGFSHGTISIRKQKTRWGSCSAKGNLSFNYRLGFLPPELLEYVVVHELCHTAQHNHSPLFWALLLSILPDGRHLRKRLRAYRF
jgi:predicted metal-dependent hydrolase